MKTPMELKKIKKILMPIKVTSYILSWDWNLVPAF